MGFAGGMWLQKPILATTWVALFFLFSEKTRPWNFGTCFCDFEFKNDEILIIYCIFGFRNQFWRQPGWRYFFCFQKKHVPGFSGRVLVILSSKMMTHLIIYGIFGFKNQFWRQPGWRYFFVFRKNTSLEFWDVFW